ncbi:unnamed protein product [Adineta steineri]|uniref:Uncharacterized protein n=1 Tax=Adineta steineri TaxID=433720 RepID=A0A814LBU8_9BILA|nr:unnamed protein product [Adineta steineri]CAF1062992.1 unnamed protein product [Adineta steineri]
MSASNAKKKRPAPTQQVISTAQTNVINSLLDCYDFVATNEYSEKTIGIAAFLTRKSVGDINFSDIIDDSEKRSRPGTQTNFIAMLEDKRVSLPEIDASVEKCLMLTRLINLIKDDEPAFAKLISDIRLDMQFKMVDDYIASSNSCDFRRREHEFNIRKTTQEVRRLFYQNDAEANNPKNLIYLQNRTTEHLKSLMNRSASDSKARQSLQNEFESIFRSSFMIVAHPHSGVNPVTIYERKGPGAYTAKISVTIVSLLYDFMQQYPNLIELFDIEPSLCPSSNYYRLEEPRSLSWKPYQLVIGASGRSHTFLCAELSSITIEQASKTDTRVRFAQLIHSFKFAIKLQLNLADSKMSPIFQIPLESLVFGIGAHNSQIPQLLTRVILEDIKRFSRIQPASIETIQYFIRRYFIHRTGVFPSDCVNVYLEQELTKAKNHRSNYKSIEDIYLDFLVNFVHQVEFMAKHPLLAMFHADHLFLGICNSERAAEAIVQSSVSGSPVIALRFNSIRIDYNTIASSTTTRAIKFPPCAVRVDIYNDRTKKLQNRTFDSTVLSSDISKFVGSANAENARAIRVLSNFDDKTNGKHYITFGAFSKYYHERLTQILKDDTKYKPVTDLVENANVGNTDEDVQENDSRDPYSLSLFSPNSIQSWSPISPSVFDVESSRGSSSMHEYESLPFEDSNNVSSPQQNVLPSHNQQQPLYVNGNNQEEIIRQLLSRPEIAEQVMRQYGVYNGSTPIASPQQMSHSPLPQQTSHSPLPQQVLHSPLPQQALHSPIPFQTQPLLSPQQTSNQPPLQGTFQPVHRQKQTQMPFHQLTTQSQPQQRQTSSSVIHYYPNDSNQSSSIQKTEQFPFTTTESLQSMTQQYLPQIEILNLSDGITNQSTTDMIQSQMPDAEIQELVSDPAFQQILAELKKT